MYYFITVIIFVVHAGVTEFQTCEKSSYVLVFLNIRRWIYTHIYIKRAHTLPKLFYG